MGEKEKLVEKTLILSSASFFRKLEWKIKHEQQCRLWALSRAIGIQYSNNHPSLTESTQEACQAKGLTKKRTEAMTKEGEGERVADSLGLLPCGTPPVHCLPYTASLSDKT